MLQRMMQQGQQPTPITSPVPPVVPSVGQRKFVSFSRPGIFESCCESVILVLLFSMQVVSSAAIWMYVQYSYNALYSFY